MLLKIPTCIPTRRHMPFWASFWFEGCSPKVRKHFFGRKSATPIETRLVVHACVGCNCLVVCVCVRLTLYAAKSSSACTFVVISEPAGGPVGPKSAVPDEPCVNQAKLVQGSSFYSSLSPYTTWLVCGNAPRMWSRACRCSQRHVSHGSGKGNTGTV